MQINEILLNIYIYINDKITRYNFRLINKNFFYYNLMFVRMNNYQIIKFAKYSNLETFKLINGNFNNVNFTSILRNGDMVIIDYLVKENLINYQLLDLHKSYSKEVVKFVIENAQKDSLGNEWWELGFFNDINLDNKS